MYDFYDYQFFVVLFVLIAFSLLVYACYRSWVCGIKYYQLNKNALKKRSKGQSFWEWLFLSRFKEEIPLFFRIFNVVLIVVSLLYIALYVFGYITKIVPSNICRTGLWCLIVFHSSWMLILRVLFWTTQTKKPYERWIKKKRGQKPDTK